MIINLKQKLILSQFWRLEVQHQPVRRVTPAPKVLEKNLFLASSCCVGSRSSLACGHISNLSIVNNLLLFWVPLPCMLLISTLVIRFRAHPDNPGWCHLKILKFIPSSKTFFLIKIWFTGSRDYDNDIFWRVIV